MKNVSDKSCRENQNTFFGMIFFPENRAIYVIMWKNIVEPNRPQVKVWRTRMACWITMAIHTHSECVIQFALPLQQILHERPSLLRDTYEGCPEIIQPF
jgi:hypothetical protein